MTLTEFISLEQIAKLPQDPYFAFAQFVEITSTALEKKMKELDDNSQSSWELMADARHSFMNHVIAAAKRYRIRDIMNIEVPQHDEFDHRNWRQFKSDLDHYVTQLLLNDPAIELEGSVALTPSLKENLRTYVVAIKTEIDRAEMPDDLRRNLLKRISEFEALLDERRINYLAVAGVIMTILGVPGSVYASYDIVTKLSANIFSEIGKAKAAEQGQRGVAFVAYEPLLLPPRKTETKYGVPGESDYEDPYGDAKPTAATAANKKKPTQTFDLDDEIPF